MISRSPKKMNEKFKILLFYCSLLVLPTQAQPNDTTSYHISTYHSEQQLPSPKWILKEGKKSITIEMIRRGDIPDAQLIDIDNNPNYALDAKTNYWFNFYLTSEKQIKDWYLYFLFERFSTYTANTFKNLDLWFFQEGELIRHGKRVMLLPDHKEM